MAEGGSKFVVYAALAGNLAIAVVKFAAAWWTGSHAMLTEAVHSLVDTGNQSLLLYGMSRSARPPDDNHPFGHGMELYFWSFVVALMIFLAGGGYSIYEGVQKLSHPEPIRQAWINFVVLGASVVFEGTSFAVAWREFSRRRGDIPVWEAIHRSKDPTGFSVILEDAAALLGLAFAALGVAASAYLGMPKGDGVASIAIGLLLIGAAVVLARETRSLLTGESASRRVLDAVRAVLVSEDRILHTHGLQSIQLGPSDVLLALAIDVRPDLDAAAIETMGAELRRRIQDVQPIVTHVFFKLGPSEGPAPPAEGRATASLSATASAAGNDS